MIRWHQRSTFEVSEIIDTENVRFLAVDEYWVKPKQRYFKKAHTYYATKELVEIALDIFANKFEGKAKFCCGIIGIKKKDSSSIPIRGL